VLTIVGSLLVPAAALMLSTRYVQAIRLVPGSVSTGGGRAASPAVLEWDAGILPLLRRTHRAPAWQVKLTRARRDSAQWVLGVPRRSIGWFVQLDAGTVESPLELKKLMYRRES
jgi:hypothetical protein